MMQRVREGRENTRRESTVRDPVCLRMCTKKVSTHVWLVCSMHQPAAGSRPSFFIVLTAQNAGGGRAITPSRVCSKSAISHLSGAFRLGSPFYAYRGKDSTNRKIKS